MRCRWTPRDIARKTAVALAAVAAALLLRLALRDVIGPGLPFFTFLPAVVLAALFGGGASGLAATALLCLAAYAWALPPLPDGAREIALLGFALTGVLVSWLAESLHRSRRRAAAAEAEAVLTAQTCELNDAKRQLAAIVESTADAIVGVSLDGVIVSWNRGAQQLYGYAAEEVLGRPTSLLCRPACSAEFAGLLERILSGEGVKNFETRRRHKNGSALDVSITLSAIRDDSGTITGASAIVRDITAGKRMEAALRAEKERLACIIETSSDLMYLKDTDLRYLAANAALGKFLGADPADMLGRSDRELMPPELAQNCRESDIAALTDGSVDREERHDGRIFRASKRRVEDAAGQVLGVAATITDISEDRRSFEALRESEERFRQLVENAPDAIFVQTGGCFAFVNDAFLRLYGAERPEQVLGRPIVSRVHPAHHQAVQERIRLLNDQSRHVPSMEMRHLRLDGGALDVEVSAVPLVYGGERGALVFVRDIAARKREEALREDMERIARHDLKTPLNAVINLPLLLMGEPNLTPEQLTRLEMIHAAGLRMLEQIDQALTLYRIETGSYALQPQPVDLGALARQVAGDLAPTARGLEVELRVEADLKPVLASGDQLLCRTMLANLMKNAAEAAPKGGQARTRIAVETGRAVIVIHNQGAVPEELRERFFEKYASLGKRRGAGLGTYSARLSAEAQRGDIAMTTSEDAGTTVTVRLPLWDGPQPARAEEDR